MSRRALITGITGQDGSYLAEFLLAKGYQVHGIVRRASTFNTARIDHIYRDPHEPDVRLRLHHGDLTDGAALAAILRNVRPDEVYHLAAQSHVRVSFDIPEYTAEVTGLGALRILEAVRQAELPARVYLAGSSELFGRAPAPQNELTPIAPVSPYGAAKAFALHIAQSYREAYGMFAVTGILFNHESERRGETFAVRKITRAAGRIAAGLQRELYLGNLTARRDFGYAPDYVDAMWRMLQAPAPADLVVGTGESHAIQEVVELAFGQLGLDWRAHVREDARYRRPAEIDHLCADAARARRELGWAPRVGFAELVARMVAHDAGLARREAAPAR